MHHYGRHRLCLAPSYLPSAIHRALGKGHLCLAQGPRQRQRSAKISLPRVVPSANGDARQRTSLPSARRSAKARSRQRTSFPSAKRSAKACTWQRDSRCNMGYLPSPFAERRAPSVRRSAKASLCLALTFGARQRFFFDICFQTFLFCITHYLIVYVKVLVVFKICLLYIIS